MTLALLGQFSVPFYLGYLCKYVLLKVLKINFSWPVFLYMPIPAIGKYFIAVGGISYGLINAFVSKVVVMMLVKLPKLSTRDFFNRLLESS